MPASDARRFPFIGHGVGAGNEVRLWVLLARRDHAIETADAALREWAKQFRVHLRGDDEGPVLRVWGKGMKSLAKKDRVQEAHDALDKTLLAVHAKTPIALVVRDNKVELSDWHRHTIADATTTIAALRALVDDGDDYVAPGAQVVRSGHADVRDILLESARWRLQPRLLELALTLLRRLSGAGAHRAVVDDLLLEQLPSLWDRDFDCDVMLREAHGAITGLTPTGIKMSARFAEESQRRLHAQHHKANDRASWHKKGEGIGWNDVAAVRKAIGAKELRALLLGFDDADFAHGQTLAALTGDELLALAAFGDFPRLIANAAVHILMKGDFVTALRLYDAAIEGELPFNCAANPLYAVQNDNNHLGVDEKRSRRYLQRCLPHAERNPAIFINAACVYMELGEHDAAVKALQSAKDHDQQVKQHRHEALFVPLRDRADFKKLMR